MVDELIDLQLCRVCGGPLGDLNRPDGICGACIVAANQAPQEHSAPQAGPVTDRLPGEKPTIDPDRPVWGPLAGIGIWMVSVAAILFVPVFAVFAFYVISRLRGAPVPAFGPGVEFLEWLKAPPSLLVQVVAVFLAHLMTLAIAWPVVTGRGVRGFFASLGWHWARRSVLFWILFSVAVVVSLLILTQVTVRFLPQSEETAFAELLKSSATVRLAVALVATLSAPIVEEVIYRGILFAALRKVMAAAPTIVLVTLLFAGVHVIQYWGAWVTLTGLVFLSLILTTVRAMTKSILPCVLIHFVNNAFFSTIIVLNRG